MKGLGQETSVAQPAFPEGIDFTTPTSTRNACRSRSSPNSGRRPPCGGIRSLRKSVDSGEGFWVVTRHEEVKEVSQRSDIFSTHENTAIPRFADDIPRENVEMQRFILINKDAPEHTKLRKLVSRGFTPRAINSLREELTERAEKIVKTAAAGGAGDFVVQVASELPLQAIAELLGVPQEDRMKLFDWSNQMTSYDDPEFDIDPQAASMEILGYAYQMADQRKQCPAE